MEVTDPITTVCSLAANQVVVDFVKRIQLRNYQRCTDRKRREISDLYQKTFDLLASCGEDRGRSGQVVRTIAHDMFRKDNPDVWFRRHYDEYGKTVKGLMEFAQIRDNIRGGTILDLGCGSGRLAFECSQRGYNVLTTDVLDRRTGGARQLPFRLMNDAVTIPYPDGVADTALVFSVLHHIDASDLQNILAEIRRTCARVLINEDVYGVSLDDEFRTAIDNDDFLQEFVLMPLKDQLQTLMLFDFVENTFAQGIPEMNFSFQFRTIPHWQSVLAANGFNLVATDLIGFKRAGDWTGTCHALFVAECD